MSATKAIQANNIGAGLFQVGLLEQAIVKFEDAARQMMTIVMNDDGPHVTLPDDSAEQVRYHRPIHSWSQPSHPRPAQGIRVYARAAYLEPSFSPFGIATYTAVPLFNLGLAHHMMALRDGLPLERASKIYETVMGSLEDARPFDDTNYLLLHLALFTNCGHIRSHQLQNKQSALGCFETGCRILTWLHMRDAVMLVLDVTEVEGMMCNMELLLGSNDRSRCESDIAVGAAAA